MDRSIAGCDDKRNSTVRPFVGPQIATLSGMGTVREHRRAWFAHLLGGLERKHGKRGAKTLFAAKVKSAPGLISQIAGGHRQVGDELARKVEAGFQMAHGEMDGPLEPTRVEAPSAQPAMDMELLADCIAGVESGLEGRHIAPEKKAQLIMAIYQAFAETGARPSKATVLAFVRRVA